MGAISSCNRRTADVQQGFFERSGTPAIARTPEAGTLQLQTKAYGRGRNGLRRLAYRRCEFDHDCGSTEFTIPSKYARELARMYSTGTCTIMMLDTIYYGKDDFIVVNWTNGRRVAKSTKFKPLDGRFPNWKAIVDENQGNQWKGELSGPANLLLPFFQIDRKIDLRVNGRIEIYSNPIRVASVAAKKPISHDGQFDIRIDQDYVADFLRACGESFVSIRVLDDGHPVYCESDNGFAFVHHADGS